MRTVLYTGTGKHHRLLLELNYDADLLIACIKDGEISPADVTRTLQGAISDIAVAMNKGLAKRKAQELET